MFKNYLRVAIRNLLRRKGYTFINIMGLAIGVAGCLLVALFVRDELSYDNFHSRSNHIYRVAQTSFSATKEEAGATTPFKVAQNLELEYPHFIEKTVRLFNRQEPAQTLLNKEENTSFLEEHFYFADSTIFEVFDIELVRGNNREALREPLTVVLNEETARRYFGEANPVGKTLNYEGIRTMTVTGVMKPLPNNSHLKIDILASLNSLSSIYNGQEYDKSWYWNPCWTYVLLKKGVSAQELQDQLPRFVEKYYYPNRTGGERVALNLQPLTDIHLYSNLDQEMEVNGSIFYVYLFSVVAVLLLIISCINFMNLATARSTERGREVGMRKVLGADRGQLVMQFMGESFLMSFLGVVTAVLLVQLMLPAFNNLVDKQLVFNPFQDGTASMGLLILFVVVGLCSGIYPALYLSGFQPVSMLKENGSGGKKGVMLRKSLVVFQFALSTALIIGTVVVYYQLQHMQSKRMGFNEDQVIVLPLNQNLIAWNFPEFKEKALDEPGITHVTGTSVLLGSEEQIYYRFSSGEINQSEESTYMGLFVTHDFIDTYEIEVLAGRGFSREYVTDPDAAILINNKMVDHLNLDHPGEALESRFIQRVTNYSGEDEKIEYLDVVGVVEDFHYTSIKKEISPLIIRLVNDERPIVQNIDFAAIKVAPGSVETVLTYLEDLWNEINHVDPFTYHFHKQELEKVYVSETRMGKISTVFSVLCILIASLGLFGLASFSTSLRSREIGIRKTLGASIGGLVLLLSKEYIKLILVANFIAWPVTYYLVNLWLQGFPYRIPTGWNLITVFVTAALFSLIVCLLTVGYQSVKAALVNPVESIRGN